jgi:transcriptional regulator with XRE-family HTH domain
VPTEITNQSFSTELPKILSARGLTLRALAREVGGLDHAYLSRMLSGKSHVNVQHVQRVSKFLGFADDYFPEVREARVVDAIKRNSRLRDEIYLTHVRRSRRGAPSEGH